MNMKIITLLKKRYTQQGPEYYVKWDDGSLSWESHDLVSENPDQLHKFNSFALTGERPSIYTNYKPDNISQNNSSGIPKLNTTNNQQESQNIPIVDTIMVENGQEKYHSMQNEIV
ncbi:hypothetical protein pb186bvf_013219 [Paramecium bursaria]